MIAALPDPVWPWLLLAAPPLFVAGLATLNTLVWPRGRRGGRFDGRVSALVPARDEEATIEGCVRAILEGEPAVDEVVVYDDLSTDATPELLRHLQREDPRLRVVRGEGLPEGWVGKPHACHQLARCATGDVLLFVDADVTLERDGLEGIASLFADLRADVVTAVPRQVTGGFWERLVLPLLHLTYVAWLPLPLIWRTHEPRFLAANGQILAVRRDAYERAGGFESVRADVVDDMAFCRNVKRARRRVVFADGHCIARCRMYESPEEIWQGFSKNLYEGIGATPMGLMGVVVLYGVTFIAPYLGLAAAALGAAGLLAPSLVGVAANLYLRALLALRHRQAPEGVLLHPLAVLAFLAIALNSFVWNARGRISWSGRDYPSKKSRSKPLENTNG